MNTQPQNKTLIIIIAILLIANIVTLSLLLMNKNGQSRSGRMDRRAQVAAFLKNEVGFKEDQLNRYDTLSKIHKAEMKSSFDEMTADREVIFKQLATRSYSDSAIETAANAMADQQKGFEIKMLHHLKEIRSMCTPAQQQVFDTGFYKIISKRGDGRKDKSKQ